MIRRPPRSTRTDTLFPYSTLFRSEVINNDPKVKAIFINIFGGITKGDEVANGIVTALGRVQIDAPIRSEEHTSELQSLMRISYAVFCLKKKKTKRYKDYN